MSSIARPRLPASDIVKPWLDIAGCPEPAEAVDRLTASAAAAARTMSPVGSRNGKAAFTVVSPGNGFSYGLVTTLVQHPASPGNLLVAWPEMHVSLLLNMHSIHMPTYVGEKLFVLNRQHVHLLSAYTTLLDETLRLSSS